jgi:hypothetical protein
MIHRKKRFTSFPSPAGTSLTKLPLGRNNSVMTSLFPPRESLVVTSRLGTGNSRTFFLRCVYNTYIYMHSVHCTMLLHNDGVMLWLTRLNVFPACTIYMYILHIQHTELIPLHEANIREGGGNTVHVVFIFLSRNVR